MGEMSIVHGRITLRGNPNKAQAAIKALRNDDEYPWLRAEMFSIGAAHSPLWYENPVIAFAATYKSILLSGIERNLVCLRKIARMHCWILCILLMPLCNSCDC
jgi:hypothetical protein